MDYKKDAIYTYWVQYTTKVMFFFDFLLYNLNCPVNFLVEIINQNYTYHLNRLYYSNSSLFQLCLSIAF